MSTLIRGPARAGLALVGLLALGACHPAKPLKAQMMASITILYDRSGSTAMIASPRFGDAAIAKAGDAVMHAEIGDTVRTIEIGSRTGDRAVDALSEVIDRRHRQGSVRRDVEAKLRELQASDRQSGGDGATNILYTLENAQPVCTPGSAVVILSDGVENSEAYSAEAALAKGRPVRLPPASEPYLRGCTVTFVGIGIAPKAGRDGSVQTLPDAQLKALVVGWREYLRSAGVQPSDMHFTSIL